MEVGMRKRVLVGILITLLIFVVASRISKNRPEEMEAEFGGAHITHSTVYEQVGPGQPEIMLKVDPPVEMGADVIYRVPGSQAADTVAMSEISSGVWSARLPIGEKGDRIEYGFLFTSREESDAGIVTASDRTGYYLIKYKGEFSITVLILHVLCMFAAFFFIIEASLGAFAVLFMGEDKEFTVAQTRWVLLFTFLGGWPLGFALNWQRFGYLWEGFPFGYDITDNKTQLIAIFWLIVAAMVWKSFACRRTGRDLAGPGVFATAVIIASVLSMILYLVPHSL
jgi:hypothetical protein